VLGAEGSPVPDFGEIRRHCVVVEAQDVRPFALAHPQTVLRTSASAVSRGLPHVPGQAAIRGLFGELRDAIQAGFPIQRASHGGRVRPRGWTMENHDPQHEQHVVGWWWWQWSDAAAAAGRNRVVGISRSLACGSIR